MATNRKAAPAKKAAGTQTRTRARTRLAPDVADTDTTQSGMAPKGSVSISAELKPQLPAGHVMAHSPRAWTLTRDDHTKVAYPKGTCPMPKEDAEHWYAKDNGVTLL